MNVRKIITGISRNIPAVALLILVAMFCGADLMAQSQGF